MIRPNVWDDFLNLPPDAQRQVADLIASLRQQSDRSHASSSASSIDDGAELQAWQDEADYFESIRSSLSKDKTYRQKYVAIRQQEIIDVDDDKFQLAQRVKRQHPDDVVFVAKVQRGTSVVEVPSPEFGP